MEYKARSVKGLRSKVNEDSFYLPSGKGLLLKKPDFENKGHLFLVCDGMGGYKAGEVASKLCAKWFWDDYYFKSDEIKDISAYLGRKIEEINKKLFFLAAENENYQGMGTTLVGVLIKDETAYVFNVGDSRCYLVSNGEIKQLSEDDSEVWFLYKRGLLKKDEIITSNRKHLITAAIATNPSVNYHIYKPLKLPKEYELLLSTDGLHDVMTDDMIYNIMKKELSTKKKCEMLIKQAKENKSKDDITIMVVKG